MPAPSEGSRLGRVQETDPGLALWGKPWEVGSFIPKDHSTTSPEVRCLNLGIDPL